jgi:hypothetical protein
MCVRPNDRHAARLRWYHERRCLRPLSAAVVAQQRVAHLQAPCDSRQRLEGEREALKRYDAPPCANGVREVVGVETEVGTHVDGRAAGLDEATQQSQLWFCPASRPDVGGLAKCLQGLVRSLAGARHERLEKPTVKWDFVHEGAIIVDRCAAPRSSRSG